MDKQRAYPTVEELIDLFHPTNGNAVGYGSTQGKLFSGDSKVYKFEVNYDPSGEIFLWVDLL